MKKFIPIIQAVASLCLIGAVKIWAPVCPKMLDLANGNQVHMKCWFSGQAGIALAVVLIAASIAAFLIKDPKNRKIVQIVNIVGSIMLFLVFTSLIGVCMSSEMICHKTALWAKLTAAAVALLGIVDIFTGKEGQLPE